jgi:hypothetical protein
MFRLMMWQKFPDLGQGIYCDLVFCLLCLVAACWALLFKNRVPIRWPLAMFIGASALSFFVSRAPEYSVNSALFLAIYALMFTCIYMWAKTRSRIEFIVLILIAVAVASSIKGIQEFWILHTSVLPPAENASYATIYATKRACSYMGWPTSLAGFLVLFIPLAAIGTKSKSWFGSKVCMAAAVIMAACLLATGCVSAWLSLLLAAVFIAYRFGMIERDTVVPMLLVFFGLVVVILQKNISSTIAARVEYYQAAMAFLLQHPILGIGAGTFQSDGPSHSNFVHNSYLQVWVETGILGLAGLVGIARQVFCFKGKPFGLELGLLWGLIAFFIDNAFSFTFIKPNISFYAWIVLALYFATTRLNKERVNG